MNYKARDHGNILTFLWTLNFTWALALVRFLVSVSLTKTDLEVDRSDGRRDKTTLSWLAPNRTKSISMQGYLAANLSIKKASFDLISSGLISSTTNRGTFLRR